MRKEFPLESSARIHGFAQLSFHRNVIHFFIYSCSLSSSSSPLAFFELSFVIQIPSLISHRSIALYIGQNIWSRLFLRVSATNVAADVMFYTYIYFSDLFFYQSPIIWHIIRYNVCDTAYRPRY